MEEIKIEYDSVHLLINYYITNRKEREIEIESIMNNGRDVYDIYAECDEIWQIEEYIFELLDERDYRDNEEAMNV